MIRTIIVDDELLAGAGMQSLIDGVEDISVVKVFTMAGEALEFLRENVIDIVITDIEMADMNGLDLIKAVRQENLANGVIIVSSHNDFAYAQEAISRGTDSYLLKYNISREKLVEEIHKVYQKTRREASGGHRPVHLEEKNTENRNLDYILCIPEFFSEADHAGLADVDRTILANVLDGILDHYEMGTLFTPYNRKMFLVFQFDHSFSEAACREMLNTNYQTIRRNLEQYVTTHMVFGMSQRFHDTRQMKEEYREAEEALNLKFYEPESRMFFYTAAEDTSFELPDLKLQNLFAEDFSMEELKQSLSHMTAAAHLRKVSEKQLKHLLTSQVMEKVYQLLDTYQLSRDLKEKWEVVTPPSNAIRRSVNADEMIENLVCALSNLREEAGQQLHRDEMTEILDYIESHLNEKLTLPDLAERANMSVPSFGRKFKEKTGMSLVQYLNTRRIEAAKKYLLNENLTLDDISERTGFSNTNYMIRVFKKITGQTITDFRK